MLKYYSIRFLASFLFYGSFAFGFLAGAAYGKWVGFGTFAILGASGIFLFRVVDRIRHTKS